MTEKVLLKELLFNRNKVEKIADELALVYPAFDRCGFVEAVIARFPELELKARIAWIATALQSYLPPDYRAAVAILLKALPAPNNPDLADDDFGDFIYAPYADYVAKYGCTAEDLPISLNALYEITQRFSAEDAIRYFINAFPAETLAELLRWTTDPHYHVRRLCSEGTRPKLPWAQKITIPVTAPLAILDQLFADRTRFVTRSVANHINDMAKIDPDLAVATLARWQATQTQTPTEMAYIIRHALRTLIKNGNPQALALLGVSHLASVSVSHFDVPSAVAMDTTLVFSLQITAQEETALIVDYILYFQNKAGQRSGRKVFKLKKLALAKGESVTLTKRHRLYENMTTRKLFRGEHEIEIQINGKSYGKRSFHLV
jgi:3-methyladenine DNA glycosylase AlkC